MPEIKVESLTYEYPGCKALDAVSFVLPSNSVTALVGPNGSGKTTLMRCLAGLEVPVSGDILIADVKVLDDPRSVFSKTGYLHDSFGVYAMLTVGQCLQHSAAMRGANPVQEKEWVALAASRLGLGEKLQQYAGSLSRGWKQRLGIAQAIVHSPEILILDEPASGLDPDARAYLSDIVRQLHAEGMTIIISSHILTELQAYSTHMLTLVNGNCLGLEPLSPAYSAGQRIRINLAQPHARLESALRRLQATTIVSCNDLEAEIDLAGDAHAQAEILKALVEQGLAISSFAPVVKDIQQIYQQTIKRNA